MGNRAVLGWARPFVTFEKNERLVPDLEFGLQRSIRALKRKFGIRCCALEGLSLGHLILKSL